MLTLSIIIYLLLTLLVGFIASKFVNSSKDYALAGRRMPMFITASALFATWFGSETIIGASSEFVEKGIQGVIEDPFGASLCLILLGTFFARPLYNMNLLTLGDFFKQRYGPRVEIVAAIFMMLSYFGWTAAQFMAFGIVLNTVCGIEVGIGVIIGASIVLIYTYAGGMLAISITDFLQTIVIIVGLVAMAVTLFYKLDDWSVVIQSRPEGFFNFLPKPGVEHYLEYICAWITIGLGSLPQQDLYQRVMSADSEKTAVRACYMSGAMYLTIGFLPSIIAVMAITVYPELAARNGQEILVNAVTRHEGLFIQVLFFGALLSAIMSTASSAILASATIFAENIIKPLVNTLDEKHFLLLIRTSVVIMTFVGVLLANSNKSIYQLVGESSMLTFVALFIPLVSGLWLKQTSSLGAELSMLSGVGFWFYAQHYHMTLLGVHIPSLLVGFFASATAMLVGYLFTHSKFFTGANASKTTPDLKP